MSFSRSQARQSVFGVSYQALIFALCGLTNIKIGNIAIDQLYDILAIFMFFAANESKFRIPRHLKRPVRVISQIFLLLIIGAVYALLTQHFYIPADSVSSVLKRPGLISISRMIQLLIEVIVFVMICDATQRDPRHLASFARYYIFGALISAIYGLISYYLFFHQGIDIGGTDADPTQARLTAFFVEGGPYGIYATSALFLLFLIRDLGIKKNTRILIALPIIASIIFSASKASIVMCVFVLFGSVVLMKPVKAFKYFLLGLIVVVALIPVFIELGLSDQFVGYYQSFQTTKQGGIEHSTDPSVIEGRVAGSIIVPNMIKDNLLFGVGIGNYSLTRNTPAYRGLVPPVDGWDLPGLGLYGDVAEIGIPAILLLGYFFVLPLLRAKRKKMDSRVIMFCLLPLACLIFGVQITFIYPWILLALCTQVANSQTIQSTSSNERRLLISNID
jgi:hypothetical protein